MNVLKKGVKPVKKKKTGTVKKKNVKPLLSVIIPTYNCRNFIERLLDSIVNQNVEISFEVIIQDDNSTDNFMELVEPYKKKLNIKYFQNNPREIHCPGNTRLDGMSHAEGEWITFIDNDDVFEKTAFLEFKECLIRQNFGTLIVTEFRQFDYNTNEYGKEYDVRNITWLHGKFYNRKFLEDNNIKFKENLESNEDLFFNMSVFAAITVNNLQYSMVKAFTYKWINNPDSISRSMFTQHKFYIDKYYKDYLHASIDPWWDLYEQRPDLEEYIFKRTCYVILYGYFYYQALFFRNNFKHVRSNRDIFEDILNTAKSKFGATNDDICAVIYGDAKQYDKIREDAANGALNFVEYESFYDFINRF